MGNGHTSYELQFRYQGAHHCAPEGHAQVLKERHIISPSTPIYDASTEIAPGRYLTARIERLSARVGNYCHEASALAYDCFTNGPDSAPDNTTGNLTEAGLRVGE